MQYPCGIGMHFHEIYYIFSVKTVLFNLSVENNDAVFRWVQTSVPVYGSGLNFGDTGLILKLRDVEI